MDGVCGWSESVLGKRRTVNKSIGGTGGQLGQRPYLERPQKFLVILKPIAVVDMDAVEGVQIVGHSTD